MLNEAQRKCRQRLIDGRIQHLVNTIEIINETVELDLSKSRSGRRPSSLADLVSDRSIEEKIAHLNYGYTPYVDRFFYIFRGVMSNTYEGVVVLRRLDSAKRSKSKEKPTRLSLSNRVIAYLRDPKAGLDADQQHYLEETRLIDQEGKYDPVVAREMIVVGARYQVVYKRGPNHRNISVVLGSL